MRIPLTIGLFLATILYHGSVWAQSTSCVNAFLTKRKVEPTLGISPSDAERLVARVAQSIGLTRVVTVVPCTYIEKAYAWLGKPDDKSPEGEYIIFNPDWVREVLGKDEVQAVALFGHELGHFLNGDFTIRKQLPRAEQERDADRFAGCAVARQSGDFSRLEDLFSRLRLEKDAFYPDRLTSLQSAKDGFLNCSNLQPLPAPVVNELKFRIRQIDEVLDSAIALQNRCFAQLRQSRSVSGSCIRDYLNQAQVVATGFELGGIYRVPAKDDGTVWIGTSGYGVRHLPERRTFKDPTFANSDFGDLLALLPSAPLANAPSNSSVDPIAVMRTLRRLAQFSETEVLADWFKRHQAQGEYKDRYGSAYRVYEVQVDDYEERLVRVKAWLDSIATEWLLLKSTAKVKAIE